MEAGGRLSLAAAVARLTASVAPVGCETVAVSQAAGRVLAEPLTAAFDQPSFAAAAMDGWAVRAADLAAADAAAPVDLRRIGEAPAGRPCAGTVQSGQAVRIFTGGVLPSGADAVVMQEDVVETAAGGRFTAPTRVGRHVRPAGQDFAGGEILLPAGERLSAGAVGPAAAAGRAWLSVRRRPRVGLLAVGDELILPGEAPGAGRIVSSNVFSLAALIEAWGGEAVHVGVAADTPDAVRDKLDQTQGLDLAAVCGGTAAGAYDVMGQMAGDPAGRAAGWESLPLALRPCRSVVTGRVGTTAVLGLPGNPTPAFVGAVLLLAPMLRRLCGDAGDGLRRLTVRVESASEPTGDDTVVHLARLSQRGAVTVAELSGVRGAGGLRALARADALVIRPAGAPAAPPGALATAILISA